MPPLEKLATGEWSSSGFSRNFLADIENDANYTPISPGAKLCKVRYSVIKRISFTLEGK